MGRELPLAQTPGAERWSIFADFIAGGLAGLCCDALLHPIDTVKSRLHVQKGPPFKYRSMFHAFGLISKKEGRRGLYAGFAAVLIGSVSSHALMFSTYKAAKRQGERTTATDHIPIQQENNQSSHILVTTTTANSTLTNGTSNNHALLSAESQLTIVDLTSGAVGEIFALPLYVPMEVIAKRMQVAALGPARNYDSVSHAVKIIYRTEGSFGLLTGFWPTMLRDVPFTALQFSLFSFSKDQYRRTVGRHQLNDVEATGLGTIVGAISAIITNPFDVIKTRLMTQGTGSERKYQSILHCFRKMIAEEGAMSLTRGVLARVLWVAPSSGLLLGVYERVSNYLKTRWQLEQIVEEKVR